MSEQLRVGVFDWPRFAPGDAFYPPDLPVEWRLNYYANAFESACLPVTALPPPGELREEWLDTLPVGFRLSLLIDDDRALVPAAAELGDAGAGWLIAAKTAPEGWRPASADRLLWRPGGQRFAPVALLPGCDSLQQARQWIEDWLALSNDTDAAACLWVEAAAVTPARLDELRQLVELMGL